MSEHRRDGDVSPFDSSTSRRGFFDHFGGRYVAETLWKPLEDLKRAFAEAWSDERFRRQIDEYGRRYTGRPTPLLRAENATKSLGGAQIYIKLEGLANTGAHKINNAIGQALLAKRMGKREVIAETGAGQHGVATAAICAALGLRCRIYMGAEDMARQSPNVIRMRLFGAEVRSVSDGSKTLKDAINEALRDWAENHATAHYLLGSALGPEPYPDIVREMQSVIGQETRRQFDELGERPDLLIACVGGGSNALGFFSPYLQEREPALIGVEAGGRGDRLGDHAARMSGDGAGESIAHGYKSLFLLDSDGQIAPTYSISAGLDYPGIGPQLAALGRSGRVRFERSSDDEALEALRFMAEREGLLFALESAHAAAVAMRLAPMMRRDAILAINMSGRGDKDLFIVAPYSDRSEWRAFLQSEVERLDAEAESDDDR